MQSASVTPPRREAITTAVAHFTEHGYALLPGFLTAEEIASAQGELGLMFPTCDEYYAMTPDDPARAKFGGWQFAGYQTFPYASVAWSLLGLSEPVVALAEALLGTPDIRLYEAHNWAKFAGAVDYDQQLHVDYPNHTIAVPGTSDDSLDLEMFVYVHDVPPDAGPTRVVSRSKTADVPTVPSRLGRDEYPQVYEHEVDAAGPAGTVLCYSTMTFHRGSAMTAERAARYVIKASYRRDRAPWHDRLNLVDQAGREEWAGFVNAASPRQLELAGFPRRGDPFWTADTVARTRQRYPGADFDAFDPASPSTP